MHALTRLIFLSQLWLCSCQMVQLKDTSKILNELPQYWLTSSLYSGDFFGDDELQLVDFRPFSSIVDNSEIPPRINRIIEAGTLVKISRITYPNTLQTVRSLKGPKNNIWVHFFVAKERGLVSFFSHKEHILVLPENITREKVKTYLAQILSKSDPNLWILHSASHIQEGIFKKRPLLGMTTEQLTATLGPPQKKQAQNKSEFHDEQEIWEYRDYFIVLSEGLVIKIKSTK